MAYKPNGKFQLKNVETGNLALIDFTNFVVVIQKVTFECRCDCFSNTTAIQSPEM